MKNIYLYILIAFIASSNLFAESTGHASRTSSLSNGCGLGTCHGANQSSNMTVALLSGSLMVEPGSTNYYTIRVSSTTTNSVSGINIGFKSSITGENNSGILYNGTGSKQLLDELVHSEPKNAVDKKADFDFSWKAPTIPGKYYLRAVAAACDNDGSAAGDSWRFMPVQEVLVRGLILNEPNGGESYCLGKTMNIKWYSAGIDRINIDLSSNNGLTWDYNIISNVTSVGGMYTWTIPTNIPQGDKFKIRISDYNNPNSYSITANSFGIFGPYEIIQHPLSKTLCEGETYKLKLVINGVGLKYQWRKNGANILNATDTVLVIQNAKPSDDGVYGVLIKSSCSGEMSSNEAEIRVKKLPVILKQPSNIVTCLNSTVIFSVNADGHNLTYQWFKGYNEVANGTTSTLTLENVDENDVGKYWCRVSGYCDPPAVSDTVTLKINNAAKITKQPTSLVVCERKNATLSIETSGDQMSYRWYFKDKLLAAPNLPTYTLNNITIDNDGEYYCVVKNPCGPEVKTEIVTIKVNPLPKIQTISPKQNLVVGDTMSLFVNTINDVSSYQWYFGNTIINGANSDTYEKDNIQLTDKGTYYCVVKNGCGEVKSTGIQVDVFTSLPGPRIALNNNELDFGGSFVNSFKDTTLINFIKNTGDAALKIVDIVLSNNENNEFQLISPQLPVSIEPNEEISVEFRFAPNSGGDKTSQVTFNSNSVVENNMNLKGFANIYSVEIEKTINFLKSDLTHPPKVINQSFVNNSNYDLKITDFRIKCPIDNPFNVLNNLPINVAKGDSINLEIEFAPKDEMSYLCILEIISTQPDTLTKVNLLGEGVTSIYETNDNISLYPNPVDNYLSINLNGLDLNRLKIVNQYGKEMLKMNIISDKFNIELKDMIGNQLSSGVYFVIISDNFKNYLYKIIKL